MYFYRTRKFLIRFIVMHYVLLNNINYSNIGVLSHGLLLYLHYKNNLFEKLNNGNYDK